MSKRVSVTVDDDVYAFASADAARKGMSVASVLRWYLRDGYVQREEWIRMVRAGWKKETDHGR